MSKGLRTFLTWVREWRFMVSWWAIRQYTAMALICALPLTTLPAGSAWAKPEGTQPVAPVHSPKWAQTAPPLAAPGPIRLARRVTSGHSPAAAGVVPISAALPGIAAESAQPATGSYDRAGGSVSPRTIASATA